MIEPKRKPGRTRRVTDYRTVVGFSLNESESAAIDRLVTKLDLDSRSAVIRWLIKQELAR